jgi:hypothetical protein
MDVDRESVFGIAIRNGLDGPEIECRWRRDFRTRQDRTWGQTKPPVNTNRVNFRSRGEGGGAASAEL